MPTTPRGRAAEARRCTDTVRDFVLAYKVRLEEKLQGTGFTLPQLRLLRAIDQQPEASAAALARRCHVTPQTLQSILTRATREGWIVRGSSARNGRIVTASLTAQGRAILQHAMVATAEVETELWRGAPVAAMRSMREMLEFALANLGRVASAKHGGTAHPKR